MLCSVFCNTDSVPLPCPDRARTANIGIKLRNMTHYTLHYTLHITIPGLQYTQLCSAGWQLVQPGQIITSEEFIGIMTEKYCDAESLESGISTRYLLHCSATIYSISRTVMAWPRTAPGAARAETTWTWRGGHAPTRGWASGGL